MNILKSKYKTGPVILVSRPIAFTFPLSYAYLSGYLKSKNENVQILFKDVSQDVLVKQIISLNPLLVGFGSLYPELEEIRQIIRKLNIAGRQFPIVIGGQMVSPIPRFAVSITGADYGVIGEGEITLYKLVNALRTGESPININGLVIKQGEEITVTGPGDFIENLSDLPPIPYELFPEEKWLNLGKWYSENRPHPLWRFGDKVINIHGGRGCPYECNFCYHHSKCRYRNEEEMLQEGFKSLERFKANMLYFSDDLVIATPKRAKKIVELIGGYKKNINYSISTRIEILKKMDDDLLSELKKTGCRIIGMGIESGSNRILNVIGKKFTAEDVLYNFERLKRHGILPSVTIMVGQYTETIEDVNESINLMKKTVEIEPNIQYGFTITTPFPGSQLYNLIFEKGYLKDDKEFYDKYFYSRKGLGDWQQIVNLSSMTDDEVFQMHHKIEYTYKIMQEKMLNKLVFKIDNKRKKIGRKKYLLDRITMLLPAYIKKIIDTILYPYYRNYEYKQLKLEKAVLKLRNIIE